MKCVRKDVCSCWKISIDELEQIEKDVQHHLEYRWVAQLMRFKRFSYMKVEGRDEIIFQVQNSSGSYTIGYEGDYLVLYALGEVQIYSESLFNAMFDVVIEEDAQI